MANLSHLPKAVFESYEWQESGACIDRSVEEFFLPEGLRTVEKSDHEAAAIRICGTCPVVRDCLQHALRARERYGVWGGLSADERAKHLADDSEAA
ncbi:WhiB family transcriptional regulator [Aeromicrobium sp. Root495]|uniref:WhiB family transcriptional regulator n=1 Tax=Aeromicrobium sp. Root495 TaxID=1736550 RepID=UPI0009EBD48E|nr:WhiB family transcriptional regulator [Aeromicrobium sp. Root495]